MESKGMPVLISSSGSPPTGDGSAHQIIRPTPRRATELVMSNNVSNVDQMHRIGGVIQEAELHKSNNLGIPALPSNPPPTSLPISMNSFSHPIDTGRNEITGTNTEAQVYNSQIRETKTALGVNGLHDLDFSPRRVSRNNSQQYFEEKRKVFTGNQSDERPQSYTPTKMLQNTDTAILEHVSLIRKASSSSPKDKNNILSSHNLPKTNMSFKEIIPGSIQILGKENKVGNDRERYQHHEQIPVRDTGSTNTTAIERSIMNDASLSKTKTNRQLVPSSEGDLVTNVVVDGSSVKSPVFNDSATNSLSNKVSSVMYVESTGTNDEKPIIKEHKDKLSNNSNDDSGYQILSTKDEEAERDPQKNNTVSPTANISLKNKKEPSKQSRSSLVKYKAYQGRSKPKRKPQGGPGRSRNSNMKSSAHFHSNDSNADERLTKSLENANRLLDVKNAIEQLKIRSSHHPSNYMNPGYSSNDNDNTSTSSYSSASDDSDHVSSTTKGSIIAPSISSSSSSYPVTTTSGIQASGVHNASPMLPQSSQMQPVPPTTKNEHSATNHTIPLGDDHFTSDHFSLKSSDQPHQRHMSGKRTCNNNVPDETHNTTVTSADEFVWIDSYNRLVELQKFPWNHTDLCAVMSSAQSGRDMTVSPLSSTTPAGGAAVDQQEHKGLFQSADILPRLSYYLQRALVRIAREAQRLSKPMGKCGRHEVCSAIKIVLTPPLALAAVKACLRATAMFSISTGDGSSIANQKQTKSSRAGLLLHVGKMHRWMCLVKVGRFIHEFAAIYLTAAIETILEELITKCLDIGIRGGEFKLSATILEQVVSMSSDFWGLFQPYSHLSSCRTSTGLAIPSCLEEYTKGGGASSIGRAMGGHAPSNAPGGKCSGGGTPNSNNRNIQQALLTTCVGSIEELEEMVSLIAPALRKIWNNVGGGAGGGGASGGHRPTSQSTGLFGSRINLSWNPEAFRTLYHFARCSQLEYVGQEGRSPIQELIYERPYMVLPPLMEWVRVSSAFAEHRMASYVDSDDTLQAARILLPGMDHPIRPLDMMPTNLGMATALDELEYVNLLKREMAFHMLQTGRRDLVPHALQLLPSAEKLNATNVIGVTALQLAALRGDYNVVRLLLDTGADVEGKSSNFCENKYWTALNYAALAGHVRVAKLLMDRGSAHVEGGAIDKEIIQPTETPLMLAAASGSIRMVELLLSYSASPFLSTIEGANTGFNSFSVGGCHSAISVASAHGHKRILNVLVSQALTPLSNSPESSSHNPTTPNSSFGGSSAAFAPRHPLVSGDSSSSDQVLSLAEMLAEGAPEDSSGVTLGPTGTIKQKGTKNTNNPTVKSAGIDSLTTKLGGKSNVRKLQEAMYHACEATNLEVTLDLRNNLGVPWTLHTWLQTLTTANDNTLVGVINELLQDFSTSWAEEQSSYFLDVGLPLLLSIFRNSKTEGTVLLLADIFSACFGRTNIDRIELPKSPSHIGQSTSAAPRIDPKFINNPELSDVQFRVEGRTFYAHKLVLVTASSRFASMLGSRFCEGSPPVLQINDIRYEIFHLVMVYLYNGGARSLQQVEAGDVLELMAAANFFQLPGLLRYCESRCSHLVDLDNIVSYYIHAKVYNATQLLAYCEGFLLQNMVALLTYDDSVKRLLFGKKLQNHDVLAGLLFTLQNRVKSRSKK